MDHDVGTSSWPGLSNTTGPVPLVLDLRIVHDRFGSRSDPSINGTLHYPNDVDRSLNEAVCDKIKKYLADYNNRPPTSIFMPDVASTSGRFHSEFVLLLFLQAHRETDRFFSGSGVQHVQVTSGHFKSTITVFSSQLTLKAKTGLVLDKDEALRIILNIDGAPIAFRSHSPVNTLKPLVF